MTTQPPPAGPAASDKVVLAVPGSSVLAGPPRVSYVTAVEKFARAVLREASNLEEQERTNRRAPREYHSKHIERAATWVRESGSTLRPRSAWYLVGRIAQAILVIATSIFLTFMVVPEAWSGFGYLFTISLVLTVMLTVIVEVIDWRSRR
ncbi:hypothetical protein MK786_01145 [Microbacterium sp. CFH 31415]|uniref:hypothetical protein n=1 Tax=Microbacterium sp. CFH 31415 TaxID=2921732 RepID=UPI001F1299C8|nr:hypothetical protein [Microbacterium sp. CFH 31415]MCH6229345.1 hypothetical protein [Microbacterium sp. CFH 31415]